jgi:penicillin-binding protein 2
MQILDHKRYKTLADQNRINLLMVPASRGQIFSHDGVLLASNHSAFRLMLNKAECANIQSTTERLIDLLGLSAFDAKILIKLVRRISRKQPEQLIGNLSWEEIVKIEENIEIRKISNIF